MASFGGRWLRNVVGVAMVTQSKSVLGYSKMLNELP